MASSRVSAAHNSKLKNSPSADEPAVIKAKRDRAVAVIGKASTKTAKDVVESVSTLKLELGQALDTIGNAVTAEIVVLKEVQEAIEAERANLENLHGIKAQADSLEALIQAQSEQGAQFEVELATERAKWTDEQRAHTRMVQERDVELAKKRKWEQEQFDYETGKKRKNEQDAWDAELIQARNALAEEVIAKGNELQQREDKVAAVEQELIALRGKVAQAEEATKKEVERTVAIATNSLKKDLTNDFNIAKLGLENQLNLKNAELGQKVDRIKELEKANLEISAKYAAASDKVQQIAEKAIEGASRQQTVVQVPSQDNDGKRRG